MESTAKEQSTISRAIFALLVVSMVVFGHSCKKETEEPAPSANRSPGEFTVSVTTDMTSALITWTEAIDPDGDAVSYRVIFENDTLEESIADTEYDLVGLQYETDYSGAIEAFDSKGATKRKEFSFNTGLTPNSAPGDFTLNSPSNGQTNISNSYNFDWSDSVDPDGDAVVYDLYMGQSSDPTGLIAVDITTSNFVYDIAALQTGTVYHWKVVARDPLGAERVSEVFSYTTETVMTALTLEPGWYDRMTHTTVIFQGKVWVIGGAHGAGGRHSDVWSSADGITWTEEVSDAPWGDRAVHASVVHDNKIWIIGGNSSYTQAGIFGDIWYSENGVDWILATDSPAFPKRFGHEVLSYNGYIWMFGGRDADNTFTAYREVWRSANGVDWELVDDLSDIYFRTTQHVVFDDRMWRISGYDTEVYSSTDGINWTLETDSAPFGSRVQHSCSVHDGRIWLASGSDYDINELVELPDLWSSEDGITWSQESMNAGFEPVASSEMQSFNGQLLLIGGGGGWQSFYTNNDVWGLE